MTQEKIDSIRERMCDEYCKWQGMPVQRVLYGICNTCPLNELVPSAEKTGKWIKENRVLTSNPPQYVWHCSECGTSVHGYSSGILTPYCSNCGAKMEVEE